MEFDINKVYDSRTKEYLQEVLACYKIGSYRSAIVLLNSVCLCDIFYKLQELRDIYSDNIAGDCLKKIETQIAKDKTSPGWEKTLVESVFNNMSLLDSAGYTLMQHLHDYRNLTAHPVMDGLSSLYQPSRELVESCLVEAYNSILTKPSFFVKSIVNFMSTDIDSKKGSFLQDNQGFIAYVTQKYLIHMSDEMVLRVFRAFWKFEFMLDDDKCRENRQINYVLLNFLYEKYTDLINQDFVKDNRHYGVNDIRNIYPYLVHLLAYNTSIFPLLPQETQSLVNSIINNEAYYELIAWFTKNSKVEHIDSLITKQYAYLPKDDFDKNFVEHSFEITHETDALMKYYVHTLRNAGSFDTVNIIMERYIIPNMGKMSRDRLLELVQCCNDNNQIYWNYNHNWYCRVVWNEAKNHFDKDEIISQYQNFAMPK